MRLLKADNAIVDLKKINDYLLSPAHPEGRTKARFFVSHGFVVGETAPLVTALLRHAREGEVRLSRQNVFGYIHTVRGPFTTPDGRAPMLESVWIIEYGKPTADYRLSKLMISEHDLIVLTTPLPLSKLQPGDVGTVVHIYKEGQAYEVEFSTMQGGSPFALVTVEANQIRPLSDRDLFHVRELAA